MPVPADDDMIVYRDPERLCDLRDLPRHLDVGARRCRIAGGMIVHQNDGGCGQFQCAFDHFARIDRRMVDSADLLDLVDDELVAFVEKQDAKLLPLGNSLGFRKFARESSTLPNPQFIDVSCC